MAKARIVRWRGDELLRQLQDANNEALYAGGEVLLADATRRAPERTGRLRASGYISTTSRSSYVKRKGNKKERKPAQEGIAAVGFAARHSHLIELGTRRLRARPFLRPALDSNADRITLAIAHIMGRALK